MKYFLFIWISAFCFSQKQELKTGDLLFQTLSCGPLCEAINEVTDGYNGLDFNHIGLVSVENDSIFVIEANGNQVKKTKLAVFLNYSTNQVYIGRLKRNFRKYITEAISFANQQIGLPYDAAYLMDNGKYYCSELIYEAFLYAYKKPLFELQPMTFKSPKDNTFFVEWKDYYDQLNMEIPEGELGCNPGGISKASQLEIIGTVN